MKIGVARNYRNADYAKKSRDKIPTVLSYLFNRQDMAEQSNYKRSSVVQC